MTRDQNHRAHDRLSCIDQARRRRKVNPMLRGHDDARGPRIGWVSSNRRKQAPVQDAKHEFTEDGKDRPANESDENFNPEEISHPVISSIIALSAPAGLSRGIRIPLAQSYRRA